MRVFSLLALATSLVADGGGVVVQKTVDDLRVTVIANPLPMSTGPEQIAVLVETQAPPAPVQDARVAIRERSPEGRVQEVEATGSQLQEGWYTVRQQLPAAGQWGFEVLVEHGGVRANVPVEVRVQNGGEPTGAFLPLIAIAPLGAILFLLNRVLRGRGEGFPARAATKSDARLVRH